VIYDRKLTASGLKGIRTFPAISFTPSIHTIPLLHGNRHLLRFIAYTVCPLPVYTQPASSSLSTALSERGRFALFGILVEYTTRTKQCVRVPTLSLVARSNHDDVVGIDEMEEVKPGWSGRHAGGRGVLAEELGPTTTSLLLGSRCRLSYTCSQTDTHIPPADTLLRFPIPRKIVAFCARLRAHRLHHVGRRGQ
jgi:hypothetical protein